jgi:hypothetical protein
MKEKFYAVLREEANPCTIATWYNTVINNNIGKFNQVQIFINSGEYQAAYNLNESIITELLPEQNQKTYNKIYLGRYLRMQSMPVSH